MGWLERVGSMSRAITFKLMASIGRWMAFELGFLGPLVRFQEVVQSK